MTSLRMEINFFLYKGNLCPALRKGGDREIFLHQLFSQLPSVQSNPFTKVASFEVTYSDHYTVIGNPDSQTGYVFTSHSHLYLHPCIKASLLNSNSEVGG